MDSQNQPDSSRTPAPAHATAQNGTGEGEKGNQSQLPPQLVAANELADLIESKPPTAKSLRAMIAALPDVQAMIVATAVRCLGAQRMMGGGKSGVIERCDDGATQMKAAAFLAAYLEGLPTQTILNLNADATKDMPMEEMLAKSPALVAAMERQIERAKSVQKRGGLKQAVPASGDPAG